MQQTESDNDMTRPRMMKKEAIIALHKSLFPDSGKSNQIPPQKLKCKRSGDATDAKKVRMREARIVGS